MYVYPSSIIVSPRFDSDTISTRIESTIAEQNIFDAFRIATIVVGAVRVDIQVGDRDIGTQYWIHLSHGRS